MRRLGVRQGCGALRSVQGRRGDVHTAQGSLWPLHQEGHWPGGGHCSEAGRAQDITGHRAGGALLGGRGQQGPLYRFTAVWPDSKVPPPIQGVLHYMAPVALEEDI